MAEGLRDGWRDGASERADGDGYADGEERGRTTTTTRTWRRGVRVEDEIAGASSLGREDWVEGTNDGKVHEGG